MAVLQELSMSAKLRRAKTDEERLWLCVEKTDGCWNFTGSQTKAQGYGKTKVNGKWVLAHRYSFFLANHEWPEPFCLHSCDNPRCVNPEHLRAGNAKDNMNDRRARHRFQNISALQKSDIVRIKELLAGGYKQEQVGQMFGLHQSTVSNIKTGKHWEAI